MRVVSQHLFIRIFAALLAAPALPAGLSVTSAAFAQEAKPRQSLGQFRDWAAIAYTDATGVYTCMAWTDAKGNEDYTSRGEPFMFVTHRPAEGQRGHVSTEVGYQLAPGTEVAVRVGEKGFALPVAGSAAAASVEGLMTAMRAGSELEIEARGADGRTTIDRYSLFGFTAASRALDEACPAN